MQSNSVTLLRANIADIYLRNYADTIHRQHHHIGRYISACRYIGRVLVETAKTFGCEFFYCGISAMGSQHWREKLRC